MMKTYRSITFNNKNSIEDFDLYVNSVSISEISKKRITKEIPYRNGTIDFSNLFGESIFSERTLTYTFDLIAENSMEIEMLKTKINDWLLTCGEMELFDSSIIGLHFRAECTDIKFDDEYDYSFCTVTFKAYPFKIGDNLEDEDWLWNPFCFETDVINQSKYDITEEIEIKLYNVSSHKVIPEIVVDGKIEIEVNNIRYTLTTGMYNSYNFKLNIGENTLKLSGNGSVKFNWRREVL